MIRTQYRGGNEKVAESRTLLPVETTSPIESVVPSTGPLLTGNAAFDICLGFLGEAVAISILIYFGYLLVQFFIAPASDVWAYSRFVQLGIGAIPTAVFGLCHTSIMRQRYPLFARGWLVGRQTMHKGVECFYTLLLGAVVLLVLFPLGMMLCYGMIMMGAPGWFGAVIATYIVGMLTRRIYRNKKKIGARP